VGKWHLSRLLSDNSTYFSKFFNYDTKIWDIVPGHVILSGAGGYCTSSLVDLGSWSWNSVGILAAANKTVGEDFARFTHDQLNRDFPTMSEALSAGV